MEEIGKDFDELWVDSCVVWGLFEGKRRRIGPTGYFAVEDWD